MPFICSFSPSCLFQILPLLSGGAETTHPRCATLDTPHTLRNTSLAGFFGRLQHYIMMVIGSGMEVQSAFVGAAATGLGMGDAFHVDDLLYFSNEDIVGPIGETFHLSSLDSTVTTAAAGETVSGDSAGVSLTGNKHLLDFGPDDHAADVLCVPVSSAPSSASTCAAKLSVQAGPNIIVPFQCFT